MSSPCLSGGGRAYGFDLEIVKSPSTSARTSQTSSPSSTLSEASNSQLAICTRKCRTPRKRPNQTYNEAAALLSTAYPNVFSNKILTNPRKISKPHDTAFYDDASELLLPFRFVDSSGFLLHQPEKPNAQTLPKLSNQCKMSSQSHGEVDFQANSKELDEDFDAESILDEEIEEGIDSIMGNPLGDNSNFSGESDSSSISTQMYHRHSNLIGWGIGRNFEFGFGLTKGSERAIRQVDDKKWWCFPTVDVLQISPRLAKIPSWDSIPAEMKMKKNKNKKKKKKVEKWATIESLKSSPEKETLKIPKPASALLLKLNCEDVANAWSDRGSPFSNDGAGSDWPASDLAGRLAQVELFMEGGGVREASVLRYREKRRTRLFSKKIRYQVRKLNADRRPRMKGRFVRRPNSQR